MIIYLLLQDGGVGALAQLEATLSLRQYGPKFKPRHIHSLCTMRAFVAVGNKARLFVRFDNLVADSHR